MNSTIALKTFNNVVGIVVVAVVVLESLFNARHVNECINRSGNS